MVGAKRLLAKWNISVQANLAPMHMGANEWLYRG